MRLKTSAVRVVYINLVSRIIEVIAAAVRTFKQLLLVLLVNAARCVFIDLGAPDVEANQNNQNEDQKEVEFLHREQLWCVGC